MRSVAPSFETRNTDQKGHAVATVPQIAVEATQLTKSFGETRALRGLDLSARAGEIHAIVGENGSGKSTFAKILSGIIPADSGTIEVYDAQGARSPREAARLGVVPVLQEVLVAEGRSVVDNVFLGYDGPWRNRMSARAKRVRAADILADLTGEAIDPLAPVESLPLAQRQWVTIARALIREPRVLVLDESTAALDLEGAQRLYAEAERLRDNGVCVLIVTHRIAELVAFADRATVLRDGAQVGALEGDEITEPALLSLMSGVKDEQATSGARAGHPSAAANPRRNSEGSPVLLHAQGLQTTPAARPSDFEIRAGEVVGFAGLDGQGQSAFLQALVGVQPASAGEVLATTGETSEPHQIDGLADAEHASLAFVSGDRRKYGIFPNLSIFENFAMHLYRSHAHRGVIDRRAVTKRFDEQIQALAIKTGDRRNLITSLSGGNQQKVLIGRALTTQPRVIALDDPARGIDVATKRELYGHLRNLAAAGSAVIYLSTEIDEFIGFCDKVAVFRDGYIFTVLEGDRITNDGVLAAMFGHAEDTFDVEHELGATS